ncbi:MAG TPA: leucine-rich repeat domain-containing protein [bacterium]|nr:leucine-rich repeat domain-containing protein [bacterium]HPN45117.1 leucine-rich repeat domain-containing protein [bacterium]
MRNFKVKFSVITCLFYIGLLFWALGGVQQAYAIEINNKSIDQVQGTTSVKVTFNDPRLELAIRNALGKPTGDIEDIDMALLTDFSVQNDSVADLTGLEYAINLKSLDFHGNRIIDLAPLQGLVNLTNLSLSYNQITDITPLAGLLNLTQLSLNSNQLTDIAALQNLVKLTFLELDNNPIGNITALANLDSLENLYISNTPVTDINALRYLLQLSILYLDQCRISDFTPLQNLTTLQELYLDETDIHDLSVLQNLTHLTTLAAANNKINNINTLQALPQLMILNLNYNPISDFTPLLQLPNIQELYLEQNDIRDLSILQNMTQLKRLHLNYNLVRDIHTLKTLTELEYLYIRYNNLDHDDLPELYGLDKLKYLNIKNNPGILSGTKIQTLADSLDGLDCENINWSGVCGIDPNAVAICWIEPDTANINELVTVQATGSDTNQSRIRIRIDWGDDVISEYSELQANASIFTFTHTYSQSRKFRIRVMRRNESGVETPWSPRQDIVILDNNSINTEKGTPVHSITLAQNYPNPFNASTTIHYSLPRAGHIKVSIYNLAGQAIARLVDGIQTAGEQSIVWNGRNNAGLAAPSGVYIYQIESGTAIYSRKMVLLR